MMLGRNANGIYWMFRYLERSENIARLLEAGMRIALTRSGEAEEEWKSVLRTTGDIGAYTANYDDYQAASVVNWLLRDKENDGSVLAILEAARNNGRMVRTTITREVWEATNECYLELKKLMARPVRTPDLIAVLAMVKQQSARVRGALHGTMLRNDTFNFARMGTFVERADNSARLLDVKYYVLLPSVSFVGSSLDNVQWDHILRALSAQRSYRWLHPGETKAVDIAQFLILDERFPRSLLFCCQQIMGNLMLLENEYGERHASHELVETMTEALAGQSIDLIFEQGLHEYLGEFKSLIQRLGHQIEQDYRFHPQ